MKILNNKINNRKYLKGGFSLFIAVVIMGALLLAAYSISYLSSKELSLTTSNRESQYAYFAADAGIECALYWDSKSNPTKFDPSTSGSPITCNGQSISTGAALSGTTTTALIGGGGSSAISRVQTAHAYAQSTNVGNSTSFSADNTAGNFIFVEYSWNDTGQSPTISDSAGNTYTSLGKVQSSSGTAVSIQIWYAENIKGGPNTMTVSNGGNDPGITAIEYSGIAQSNSFDLISNIDGSVLGSTNTPTSNSFSPAAGDLVINTFADEWVTQTTMTAGTGYSMAQADGNHIDIEEDNTNASAGSQTASLTLGNATNQWVMSTVAFKSAGGGGNPTSVFGFSMTSAQNPSNACVVVSVTKNGSGGTDINSYGYNTCNTSDPKRVERGIEVKY